MLQTSTRSCAALLLLLPLSACPGDDEGSDETTTVAATSTATDGASTGESTDGGTAAESTGEPLPDPGQQNDPCACEGDDPNSCDAASSNCGDPLSCIASYCRQACESLDDESCPEGTACFGVTIDGTDLGFWCG